MVSVLFSFSFLHEGRRCPTESQDVFVSVEFADDHKPMKFVMKVQESTSTWCRPEWRNVDRGTG